MSQKSLILLFLLFFPSLAHAVPIVLYNKEGQEVGTSDRPLKVSISGSVSGANGISFDPDADRTTELKMFPNGGFTIGETYSATQPPSNGLLVQSNVGIGNTNPTIPLQIGSETMNTPDGAVYLTRSVTGTGNSHGFGDESTYNLTGGSSSMNSFDANATITAIGTSGAHVAAFQSRNTFNFATTLDAYRGFFSQFTLQGGGTITDAFNFIAAQPTLTSGTVPNWYGLYIPSITGPTNVYGIYFAGSPKNIFGSGFNGFGTTSPTAKIHMDGAISSTAWTTSGIGIRQAAATYTDTSSSGTVGAVYINTIGNPTIAASSSTTYTTAASLFLGNAPAAGTNVIITNPYSLVATNNVQFRGFLGLGGTNVHPSSVLQIGGNQSMASWTTQGPLLHVGGQTLTNTTGSGTIAEQAAVSIHEPTFASSSSVTVTDASTLYVEGAPNAGTNTNLSNAWGIYLDNDSMYIRAGGLHANSLISRGTKFTISGCSAGTTVGGATAGTFVSGTTGACSVTITMNGATGITAPNGWACSAANRTNTATPFSQTASSTTTATLTGTTATSDVIQFSCIGY